MNGPVDGERARSEPVEAELNPVVPFLGDSASHDHSADRDSAASDRDSAAAERDVAATERDAAAEERSRGKFGRAFSRSDRMAASGDRMAAEQDRLFAALDRDFSDFDRREPARERALGAIDPASGWSDAARRRDLAATLRDEAARRRDDLSVHRTRLALTRDLDADLRDRQADLVDAMADLRDRTAIERDRAAAARDVAAVHRDLLALERERHVRDLEASGGTTPVDLLVTEAETDRQLAAVDRLESAMDRLAALQDLMVVPGRAAPVRDDPETGVMTAGEGLYELGRLMVDAAAQMSAALVDLSGPDAVEIGLPVIVDRVRGALTHRDLVVRWSASELLVVLPEPASSVAVDVVLADAGCPPAQFVGHRPGTDLRQFLEDVVAAAGPRPVE